MVSFYDHVETARIPLLLDLPELQLKVVQRVVHAAAQIHIAHSTHNDEYQGGDHRQGQDATDHHFKPPDRLGHNGMDGHVADVAGQTEGRQQGAGKLF